VLRRDRLVVVVGLVAVVTLAWTYLVIGAGMNTEMMAEMPDLEPMPWTAVCAALLCGGFSVIERGRGHEFEDPGHPGISSSDPSDPSLNEQNHGIQS